MDILNGEIKGILEKYKGQVVNKRIIKNIESDVLEYLDYVRVLDANCAMTCEYDPTRGNLVISDSKVDDVFIG